MPSRSWRLVLSAGITAGVWIAIRTLGPDVSPEENPFWHALVLSFQMPAWLIAIPMSLILVILLAIGNGDYTLRMNELISADATLWVDEAISWAGWTVVLYLILSFYYRKGDRDFPTMTVRASGATLERLRNAAAERGVTLNEQVRFELFRDLDPPSGRDESEAMHRESRLKAENEGDEDRNTVI